MSTAAEIAVVYRREDMFQEFVAAMHTGEVVEMDAEMYDYWLNVLPVKGMRTRVTIKGVERRADFLQGEGYEELTAFWREGSGGAARYFCQRTNIMNPYA